MQEYKKMLKNMFRFSGRARRREYWVVTVINSAVSCFLYALMFLAAAFAGEALCYEEGNMIKFNVLGTRIGIIMAIPVVVFGIYKFVSMLALTVRRYHDAGVWGLAFPLCLLGSFVCGIGAIVHLVFCLMPSKEDNVYGANPKAPENNEYEGNKGIALSVLLLTAGLVLAAGSAVFNAATCGLGEPLGFVDIGDLIMETLSATEENADSGDGNADSGEENRDLYTIYIGSSELTLIVPTGAEEVIAVDGLLTYKENGLYIQYSDSFCGAWEDGLSRLKEKYDRQADDGALDLLNPAECVEPVEIEDIGYEVFYYRQVVNSGDMDYSYDTFFVDIGADNYLEVVVHGMTDDFQEDAGSIIRRLLYKIHKVWAAIALPSGEDKQQKPDKQTAEENTPAGEKTWSRDSLREGVATAIEYDKQYRGYVHSKEEAMQAIREYGIRQRERYVNPPVEKMEMQMEKDFAILAVNLGEIEEETAGDIWDAFSYMYAAYPQLKGSITNVSLGNFEHQQAGNVAVTQNAEFMINEEFGRYPFVVKYELIFNAAKFKNRQKLLEDCAYQVQTGYWPEGSDITSVVVHELGHQLLNVIAMEKFGLEDACYITEKNGEAYSRYVTDSLSVNQSVAKAVLGSAYDIWRQEYHHTGTEEEFRCSISGYAKGEQADGGISYGETVAEAVADVYLHGEKAADASRAIVDAVHLFMEGVEENAGNLDEGTGEA